MRTEEEINNRLTDLKKAEEDLKAKIEEELRTPVKSDSVMAKVGFYTTQRKKMEAKIDELKWILNITD